MLNKTKIILPAALLGVALFFGPSVQFSPNVTAQNVNLLPQSVQLNVPFTTQAPLGEWADPRQQDGCEEASAMMAMMWVWGTGVPAEEVRREIVNMAEYEKVFYGFHQDTSAQDTAKLITDYFRYPDVVVRENISTVDIKNELAQSRLVIVPLNARLLGSALHKNGLTRHTVVITGYDQQTGQMIMHDPLAANGDNYRVPEASLNQALWNYTSGVHRPLGPRTTALISVGKLR